MGDATRRGHDTTSRKRLGDSGERVAAEWLAARGFRIAARQWRCPYGELDLVAEEPDERGGELVFVEVKTRRGDRMGAPEEAVTAAKRAKLIAATQMYLAEHGQEQRPYRIDVLAVDLSPSGRFPGSAPLPTMYRDGGLRPRCKT